jgi:hypothetical protein
MFLNETVGQRGGRPKITASQMAVSSVFLQDTVGQRGDSHKIIVTSTAVCSLLVLLLTVRPYGEA